MDPTVEPDPDNAGGGKKAIYTTPSAGAFFYSVSPLSIGSLTIQTKSQQEVNMWNLRALMLCIACFFHGYGGGKRKNTVCDIDDT